MACRSPPVCFAKSTASCWPEVAVPIGCRGPRQVEFRRSQNWIGATRAGNAHFVPPPHGHLQDCMTQLEPFIHGGRLGWLLIVLMLIEAGVLQQLKQLKELLGMSCPTVSKATETLVGLVIAREITGGRRIRLLAYDAYLAILSEGTEPL
jgi:hypothetical protein